MRRTTATRLAAGLLVAGVLVGCDGSGDDSADPSPSAGSTPTSASPSEPESSVSSGPAIEVATGPVIDQESATLNAPEGWKIQPEQYPFTVSAQNPRTQGIQGVTVYDIESTVDNAPSLAAQARTAIRNQPEAHLERLPDTRLGDAPAYHVQGTTALGPYDEISTFAHGRSMSVQFVLKGLDADERQDLIDSVLASFQWKE